MSPNDKKKNTRIRIIEAAKNLFAEQGYQKATVSDIAKGAKLSEPTIYEYFQSKEEILLTIPDLWVKKHIAELEEQLFGIKGAFNKLRKFMWWHLRCMEKDPLEAKITFHFLKTNANFMKTDVYAQAVLLYSYLLKFFEEGVESGEMKPDLTPYVARSIFIGTMDHIISRWLLKDMSYSLFDNLEETFDHLVDAFRASDSKAV